MTPVKLASIALYVQTTPGFWTSITDDVYGEDKIVCDWGISGNKPLDRLAKAGSMSFTLKNSDGKYSPDVAGAMVGWKKGIPVKLEVTFDGVTYVRFRGKINKISIPPGPLGLKNAYVTALDWLDYAAKYPLVNPAIQFDKTADQAITTILSGMPIQPQATAFDVGQAVFPAIFDGVTQKTMGYSEFGKLAASEFGYIYLMKDKDNGETLVFESAYHRTGAHCG